MHFFRRSKKAQGHAYAPPPPPPLPWMPGPIYMPLPPPPSFYPGASMSPNQMPGYDHAVHPPMTSPRWRWPSKKAPSSGRDIRKPPAEKNASSRSHRHSTARRDGYWTLEARKPTLKGHDSKSEVHRTPRGKEYTIKRHVKNAGRVEAEPKKHSHAKYDHKKHTVKETHHTRRSSGSKGEKATNQKPRVEYEVTIIRKEVPHSRERHAHESGGYQQKSYKSREEHQYRHHSRSKCPEVRSGERWYGGHRG